MKEQFKLNRQRFSPDVIQASQRYYDICMIFFDDAIGKQMPPPHSRKVFTQLSLEKMKRKLSKLFNDINNLPADLNIKIIHFSLQDTQELRRTKNRFTRNFRPKFLLNLAITNPGYLIKIGVSQSDIQQIVNMKDDLEKRTEFGNYRPVNKIFQPYNKISVDHLTPLKLCGPLNKVKHEGNALENLVMMPHKYNNRIKGSLICDPQLVLEERITHYFKQIGQPSPITKFFNVVPKDQTLYCPEYLPSAWQ